MVEHIMSQKRLHRNYKSIHQGTFSELTYYLYLIADK